MTIEECYKELGGNFSDVKSRIPNETILKKIMEIFLNDPGYTELCDAMKAGDRETAFRAVHTLKGVCANLSFDKLFQSASALTELLRIETETIPENAYSILEEINSDYRKTINAIRTFLAET